MTGGQPTTVTYCTQGDQNKSDQDIYLTMEGQKLIILGQFSVRGSWRKSHCGKKKNEIKKKEDVSRTPNQKATGPVCPIKSLWLHKINTKGKQERKLGIKLL